MQRPASIPIHKSNMAKNLTALAFQKMGASSFPVPMATVPLLPFLCFSFLWLILCWWWENRNSIVINWPVVGMMPGLLRNSFRLHEWITDVLTQAGGTFMFKGPWIGSLDFLITSDSDNVHHILTKNFSNYSKGPEFKEIFEALGDGILGAEGESWRLQRRMIHSLIKGDKYWLAGQRATKHKILNGLFLVLDQAVESGSKLDIQNVFQRFTFDQACLLVLGYDPNCLSVDLPEVDLEKAYHSLEEGGFSRHIKPRIIWKLQWWLQIGDEKKLKKAWDTFDRFLYDCISSKREKLASRAYQNADEIRLEEYDLIAHYLVNENKHAPGRCDKFVRDTAFNILGAGRDTIASSLTWFIWLVATHPFVEKEILQEMREVIQDKEWTILGKEELSKLIYLQASILETLRLYPPVPFEHNNSVGADTLPSGNHVAGNTRIIYCVYAVGRMKEIWGEDCLEFKPERWISEKRQIKHVPSSKFLVFNAGPRTCIGKDLALLQIQAVSSALLWNYRFQVVEDQRVCPANSIVLYMKHGLKVRVFKRNV